MMPIVAPGSGLAPVAAAREDTDPSTSAQVEQPERGGRSDATSEEASKSPSSREASSERAQQLQDQQILRQLSARDSEVRQHEMAHQAAGGGHTGAVSYTFQRGPDGRMYAVGGEVSIDTSAVSGDPRATLEKAETIIRAAMAPAEPSSQDHRVAASARAMAAEARAELARMEEDERTEAAESDDMESDQSAETESASSVDKSGSSVNDADSRAFSSATGPQPLNAVQQQLVDTGVYTSLYPSGSLVNLQA
ncbi:hypothetical protein GCM10009104_35070 [Marinobacterium maritimum]|uniref:SprA-related family protein n=2 Tax=Marinobacterium maritimum TaxID=500162 RepID=A0ABN1IAQ1_9GAMM